METIVTRYQQDALVEEYIDGREVTVALLGNGELEVLPIVERDFGDRENRLCTSWEASAAPKNICPAQLDSSARVDIRIDRSGQPFVLEINANPGLGKSGHVFARSAR
ncbi:hypothetical protein [Mesorhizobium abyssinicae]|uniref:hypothetical protein n=1 Tax=Mesorhizobium abyssinicae TaxID=1209958 RepID=UPI003399C742